MSANWRLECHIGFCKCLPELACGLSCVALAWHWASGSTPYGLTAGYCISLLHRWHNWNSCHQTSTHLISQTTCPKCCGFQPPVQSQCSLHRAPIFRLLLKVAFAKMSAPKLRIYRFHMIPARNHPQKVQCPVPMCVCVAWKHTISWCCSNIVQDCCSACGRATKSIRRCFGHHFFNGLDSLSLSACVLHFQQRFHRQACPSFLSAMHCKAQTVTSQNFGWTDCILMQHITVLSWKCMKVDDYIVIF